MTTGKWGESFLKSGFPLEHLTLATMKSLGWHCRPHVEYERTNREGDHAWFELDLVATGPFNKDTDLSFLIECKYHDLSRYWFFLPHEPDRWRFDDRVINCGPYSTLTEPRSSTFLSLAPCSVWGIVVSEDGQKQDNAVYAGIQQLVNGFVPYSLETLFSYNINYDNFVGNPLDFVPDVTALIPVLVTNARILRLKTTVANLDLIRKASQPSDIADEVEWTWCYNDPPMTTIHQNYGAIEKHKKNAAQYLYRYPYVDDRLHDFLDRPNWIAVVNIKSLKKFAKVMTRHFKAIKTVRVKTLLADRSS